MAGWIAFCVFGVHSVARAQDPLAKEAEEPDRPNVLVILADDLGWRDVGYHGSEIETPHIDRIAREGVELDRFYVQPTCSPTRSGLMTGKSPMRLGIVRPLSKNETRGLPIGETILPQFLGRLGYQSLMVGKWHLGHYTPDLFPQARGFEHFYGHVTGGVGYWDHNHGGGHDWQRNGETVREKGYSTTLIADEAIRIVRSRDRSRPTFLYLAFNAPHLPNEAPEAALERYAHVESPNRRLHAGMVSELDAAIGRVLEAFEAEGMLSNTIVLFSSDNGGLVRDSSPRVIQVLVEAATTLFDRPIPFDGVEFVTSNVLDGASDNSPLKGGKGRVAEGGVRVPAAIWWPGRLEHGRHEGFMTISDVLPTLLDAIEARDAIPNDLDGRSQWGVLSGDGGGITPDYIVGGFGDTAIYRPPWKLVLGDSPRLFQIYEDPLEERDVADRHAELVATLAAAGESWPRGDQGSLSVLDFLADPDTFGGPEDRAPWADVARDRAEAVRADSVAP